MIVLMVTLMLLVVSGLAALCCNRSAHLSNMIGAIGAVLACLTGLVSLVVALRQPGSLALALPWVVPYGSFSIGIDALTAVFLFPIFILSGLCAVYGAEYLRHYYGNKNIGAAWFFFNLLIASMALVVMSRNAVLFLTAWEVMSVSSFFLVIFESEKKGVARAGLVYLVATHIGTLFLIVMFLLLGNAGGSFDFTGWKLAQAGPLPSIIFLLALVGFGTKAGLMPMHIWLPDAHPAAPSHVSAVMSGVMIKTGIYGLIRVLTFLAAPAVWWGYLLIAVGIISGVLGILFALTQHDLKRLLAYSSIENIGIITIGIGLGVLGLSLRNPVLIIAGFGGGLLHVVNHAFFKGLLFLGAGAVLHETGTREIDALGGLLKKMPATGFCFLLGAAAICGLPPLNGFISEVMIYFGSFKGALGASETAFVFMAVILSLALIGGLAVVCFTKAFGIVFLGEARTDRCDKAKESGWGMKVPMELLAAGCVIIGLAAPFVLSAFAPVIRDIGSGFLDANARPVFVEAVSLLNQVLVVSLVFCVWAALLAAIRYQLLMKRERGASPTWDCGYARPHARIQYTASSYVQPVVDFFKTILRPRKQAPEISTYFPEDLSFKSETTDFFREVVFRPLFEMIRRLAEKFTWFQHGRLQVYILYIFIALIALFFWKL